LKRADSCLHQRIFISPRKKSDPYFTIDDTLWLGVHASSAKPVVICSKERLWVRGSFWFWVSMPPEMYALLPGTIRGGSGLHAAYVHDHKYFSEWKNNFPTSRNHSNAFLFAVA
jgi:hypothetical protein